MALLATWQCHQIIEPVVPSSDSNAAFVALMASPTPLDMRYA